MCTTNGGQTVVFTDGTSAKLQRGLRIATWVEHWNDDPKPFVWHKTAAEIIEKVQRGRATLSQVNSPTDH